MQVVYNGTGSYVIMGGQTAQIVASDIILENGVMHVSVFCFVRCWL